MRQLAENEIKFFKETNFTPTVFQCDEYSRTPFHSYAEAEKAAKEKYSINLDSLLTDCLNDSDSISLEYDATYLLHTFFTQDELKEMKAKEALKFLQDFKYFNGFRKWSEEQAEVEIQEALQIYDGVRKFVDVDGDVWNKEND